MRWNGSTDIMTMLPWKRTNKVETPHEAAQRELDVIDLAEQLNANVSFNQGKAIKHIAHSTTKTGASSMKDLERAQVYIDLEIQRLDKM